MKDRLNKDIKLNQEVFFKEGNKYLKGTVINYIDKENVNILVKQPLQGFNLNPNAGFHTVNCKNLLTIFIDNEAFCKFLLS